MIFDDKVNRVHIFYSLHNLLINSVAEYVGAKYSVLFISIYYIQAHGNVNLKEIHA